MATVKVKLRKSSVPGRAGTIFYQLSHRQHTQQITTRLRLHPEEWNAETAQVIIPSMHEQVRLSACQRQIEYELRRLQRIIDSFDNWQTEYSVRNIVDRFRSSAEDMSITDFLRHQIQILANNGKLGTARNYHRALSSFTTFLGGTDLPFSAFDRHLVCAYNSFLEQRGVVRNTVSFYMRILRAVYNMAVCQQLAEQTSPFEHVYTGVDRTQKRAVGEEVITRLQVLDLRDSPSLALARDLFLFSYCTRGMAFVDMAFLRKQDIRDGMIRYIRRKTGQQLTVRLEPCIRKIVNRYAGRVPSSPYVFPIIKGNGPGQAYVQYQTALGYYNRRLKRLSEHLGLESGLSSYTSRHSWATAARNHNIPLTVISAGMGHTSERTTQIYLASLENSVIDQANENILACLNG